MKASHQSYLPFNRGRETVGMSRTSLLVPTMTVLAAAALVAELAVILQPGSAEPADDLLGTLVARIEPTPKRADAAPLAVTPKPELAQIDEGQPVDFRLEFEVPMESVLVAPMEDTGQADELSELLDAVVAEAEQYSSGVSASISVGLNGKVTSKTAELVAVNSASSAKVYWVVAAVEAAGLDAVEPYAEAIFAWSDNSAAGWVVDLVGVDGINTFTRSLGMDETYLASWSYDFGRYGSDRNEFGYSNTTSTVDAAMFLALLENGDLLGPVETATVLDWMRLAPDSMDDATAWGGVLPDALPAGVAVEVAHKAGWLPPGCCVTPTSVLIDIGVVPLPDGSSFTVAVATTGGADYAGQAEWMAAAVGDVYDLLSGPTATIWAQVSQLTMASIPEPPRHLSRALPPLRESAPLPPKSVSRPLPP